MVVLLDYEARMKVTITIMQISRCTMYNTRHRGYAIIRVRKEVIKQSFEFEDCKPSFAFIDTFK